MRTQRRRVVARKNLVHFIRVHKDLHQRLQGLNLPCAIVLFTGFRIALKTQINNQSSANRIAHARHGLKRNRRFWTNNRDIGLDDMARVRMGNRHAELLARKAGWIGALALTYGIQPGIRHIAARTQMALEQLEK